MSSCTATELYVTYVLRICVIWAYLTLLCIHTISQVGSSFRSFACNFDVFTHNYYCYSTISKLYLINFYFKCLICIMFCLLLYRATLSDSYCAIIDLCRGCAKVCLRASVCASVFRKYNNYVYAAFYSLLS